MAVSARGRGTLSKHLQPSRYRVPNQPPLQKKARPFADQVTEPIVEAICTAILSFLKEHNVEIWSLGLIALQGPLCSSHCPPRGAKTPSLAAMIAARTGVTTTTCLSQHNDQLISSSLERLELLSLFEPGKPAAWLNVANTTTLSLCSPDRNAPEAVKTTEIRDCGLGISLINAAMRYFTDGRLSSDQDGTWSSKGKVNEAVVDTLLKDIAASDDRLTDDTTPRPWTFVRSALQSITERCLFLGMSEYDTVATITLTIAQSIVNALRRFVQDNAPLAACLKNIVLCGIGAQNTELISHLRILLPDVTFQALADTGLPPDATNAACVAFQGFESLLDRSARRYATPNTSPRLTTLTSTTTATVRRDFAPEARCRELGERMSRFEGDTAARSTQRIMLSVDTQTERRDRSSTRSSDDWRSIVGITE